MEKNKGSKRPLTPFIMKRLRVKKHNKSPQTSPMDAQLPGITKVSIENIKQTRLGKLTPLLHLLVALSAVAVSVFSVYWSTSNTIEQEKISWSLTLLSQLTSNNAGLQKFAATTFAALYKKGTIPESLLPALKEAAGDPKTSPDAARILRDLLGGKRYLSPVRLGTNTFEFASFPISLDYKRFFLIGSENGQYFISVIVTDGNVVGWEVVDNQPYENPFSYSFTTRAGKLVVIDAETGDTIYKADVGSEINLSYFSPPKPQIVKVTQNKLIAGGVTLMRNDFRGEGSVGVVLDTNGGLGIGARAPIEVMDLFRKASE